MLEISAGNEGTRYLPDETSSLRGGLAQLARALDWQSKGQGFDSPNLHHRPPQSRYFGKKEGFFVLRETFIHPSESASRRSRMASSCSEWASFSDAFSLS